MNTKMQVETATDVQQKLTAQDSELNVEDRLAEFLDPSEPTENEDDVIIGDDENLPKDDDTDSDDDEGKDVDEPGEEDELTLSDFLGIEEDRIVENEDGVFFKAIIDGEEKEIPLSDLAVSYQLQGHVNNKSIALQEERNTFEEQRTQISGLLEQKVGELTQLGGVVEQQLIAEYNNINWDALRAENPEQWAHLRQEFGERAQEVQGLKATIQTQALELKKEADVVFQQKHQQHMAEQLDLMIMKNPTWADAKVMEAEQEQIRSFLTDTYGFEEDHMKMVTDHRLMSLIMDAKKLHNGTATAAEKKGKNVPKFQKQGGSKRQVAAAAKARGVKAKKAALKATGSERDAASLLLDRM